MNNDEYAAYFTPNLSRFRNFNVTIHEAIVDQADRKVVMLASSTAKTDVGDYANEYVLVVETGQDGTKAERVVEWVDSGHAVQFMGRLAKEMEKKGKTQETEKGRPQL
jgi:GTP1/Obg family GTP-binding protein